MNSQLNILMVEDNPGDADLLKDLLDESSLNGSIIENVQTLKQAVSRVQNTKFSVILLDLGLPDSSGMTTVSEILKYTKGTPVIVFTGLDDEKAGLDAINRGAQDYLVKGSVEPDLLARLILHSIERKKDAEKISHLNSTLRAIRYINQLIVKEKDLDTLITSSCDILTKERGYYNACVILFDEKNKPYKSSMKRNMKGYDEFYRQVEKGTWKGVCQKALEMEEILLIENPSEECGNCPLKAEICESHATTHRLKYGDKIYGVLSVNVQKNITLSAEEQGLLTEVAGDISFAIHDIEIGDEHKKAEKALQESEENYRIIFGATGTATLIVDEQTTILHANKECERVTGYPTSQLVGKSWTAFVYKEDLLTMLKNSKARIKDPASVPNKYEVRLINAKGEIRNTILSVGMIPSSKTSIVSMIDITERKQAEEQLKKELAEKEVLLREIRHRVKNNLQVISGLLHLQQSEIKTKEDVVKGFSASQDRILAMAKAYELLLSSEYMSDVSMGKYIESLAAQLINNYDIHNKVKINYSMDELTVNIEILDRLALALNEIITNAIKYAFEGRDSGNITIQVKGDDDRFMIKISDDGTGIPKEIKTDDPATLGLSIITMIIGQLYGTLSIERTNGTCFTLEIPQKKDVN